MHQVKPKCAFCNSDKVELFSLFGQTLLGSQYYCHNCKSIFEVVRFDDDDEPAAEERRSKTPNDEKRENEI